MKKAGPTFKTTLSRAALLTRRQELDALDIFNMSAFMSITRKRLPDDWRMSKDLPESVRRGIRFVDLQFDLPGIRMQRRDLLIARECASAPRNSVVVVTREPDGKTDVDLGLWAKGGQRVITLTLHDGDERVFLREELTYIGLVIGYIRREDRRAIKPPVHVFKTGGGR